MTRPALAPGRIRGNRKSTMTPAVIYLPAHTRQLSNMGMTWGMCGPDGAAMVTGQGVSYLREDAA